MHDHQNYLERLRDDIRLRGYSARTLEAYVSSTRLFLEHIGKPVSDIGTEDIRGYLMHLIDEKRLSASTVNQYSSSIRFFFAVTLDRTLNYLQVPRTKRSKSLPELLSREELLSIFSVTQNLKHSAILKLAYGSGLRAGEIARLKIHHIESESMRILVKGGKGGKDRYTLLSRDCLITLREYWVKSRPKNPEGWLFPGKGCGGAASLASVQYAFRRAKDKAGITKDVSIHVLRHLFATHLLEDGVNLLDIKSLLGHSSIQTTMIYLHLANTKADIVSPADAILASRG